MNIAIQRFLEESDAEIIKVTREIWFPALTKKDKAQCKIGDVPSHAALFLHFARNLGYTAEYKLFTHDGVSVEISRGKE